MQGVREGLSERRVISEQEHDWSEGKAFQAEGIWGNLVNCIVNAKRRDIAKSTGNGYIHLLCRGEETGKRKLVLYAWPGNNPMSPGGQFWVLFRIAVSGGRQTKFTKNVSIGPDLGEQSWIRKCCGLEFIYDTEGGFGRRLWHFKRVLDC